LKTTLTGVLPFVVLIAAALALPLCFLLLRWYRGAVLEAMRGTATQSVSAPAIDLRPRTPSSELSIHTVTATTEVDSTSLDRAAYRSAIIGLWQAACVYSGGAVAYAAIMTAGWLIATGDTGLVWPKVLFLFVSYLWSGVVAVLLVAGYDRIRRLQLLGAYFFTLSTLVAVALARNAHLAFTQLPLYWLIENGPPSLLLMTFLLRPIRAVGPLVLTFLIVVAVGSQSLLSIAGADDTILRAIATFGFGLGLGASGVFIGMIVVGVALFALLGWPLLRWLGSRYERKRFSDQSIAIDAIFLLFGIVQSIGLAFESPPWILTGLLAFVAYKCVTGLGWRLLSYTWTATNPRTLLLLRVFVLGKRSEMFFDKLRKHWQRVGSIAMIAGPDLVTTTVEPHEFLAFVSGGLSRRFIGNEAELERRIAGADGERDPDGRYRVNEFFCRADTWQVVMQTLAESSDAVLMDLRSFSPGNQGCVYELGRLLDGVDLTRVVFLVDETTDRPFLETTLRSLWHKLDGSSPNQTTALPHVKLFALRRQSEVELSALLRQLLGARPAATAPHNVRSQRPSKFRPR